MTDKRSFSLLYNNDQIKENIVSETTMHDLGMDNIIKALSGKEAEQTYILRVMSRINDSAKLAKYRSDIFEDIYNNPGMRNRMMEILNQINFLRDYGSFMREREEAASIWELMHRLEEIHEYICCVEAIHECLATANISSEGLVGLRDYIDGVYKDNAFAELKADISECRASTSNLKSVTLGVNLNNRFEAESIGVISVNDKSFGKSNVIGGFNDMILAKKGGVKEGNEWGEDYRFHPITTDSNIIAGMESLGKTVVAATNPIARMTLASIPEGDAATDVTRYMDRIVNHMLSITVKKLKDTLSKYINITITNITDLIPEFMYYIRWAEYIDKYMSSGMSFSKAEAIDGDNCMSAEAIYNLKLVAAQLSDADKIVTNDLVFNKDQTVYILTGANRGGKTTITQAIGQLYILAQGGIYIPGKGMTYAPVDNIYTHFPADEDKTIDLGRLGEECKRFKELYTQCTSKSLILLNETFSTTSFEEGYYIAKDAVKAILIKGARTIYNTHMHKLAYDIADINQYVLEMARNEKPAQAKSLIVKAEEGERSFKVEVANPQGFSYAEDIARKYGVTFDILTNVK